ncbi:MAG: PTS sugar transporter subunit IIA [Lachnospiraceae bacterium]|nr:PTS sugar transporter subunit IIA [Lachnospiraceae bacterium]
MDSVMLREERGQTDFGNLIAIPHAFRAAGDQKFVAVAILDNPIWWGHNYVQVILLLCFAANKDPDTERFYQSLTNFMFDDSGVASLIEKRSFDTLISALLGMEN